MTEHTVFRIPASDLTTLAIGCKHCGAETVINVANEKQSHGVADERTLCGVCRHEFDSSLRSALMEFHRCHLALKNSGATAAFVVSP